MAHLAPQLIVLPSVAIALPVSAIVVGGIFRICGYRQASRACVSAGIYSYIAGATAGFTSVGVSLFTYGFGWWRFPPDDARPSTTLYVCIIVSLVIIPLIGFVAGALYGAYRTLRRA